MTIIAIFPAILCLIGLLVWALTADAPAPAGASKVARVAWVMYVVGLAGVTYALLGWVVRV